MLESEWVSTEAGISLTGVIGNVTDRLMSGTLVVSEKVWPIVYCVIKLEDERVVASARVAETM